MTSNISLSNQILNVDITIFDTIYFEKLNMFAFTAWY